MEGIEMFNNQQYYTEKIENIEILESSNYKELDKQQEVYQNKIDFYTKQKDKIGIKIRMLEVYQNLWEDIELQMVEQAFLNDEFWNNITFNILKYDEFIRELNEVDYNKSMKNIIDKKSDKDLWDRRQQLFTLMKNDINNMNSNFNKMHDEIHKRALIQRECIQKHINLMKVKYEELELQKERYRKVFYEVQKAIGAEGNKISKKALRNYRVSLLEKAEYAAQQPNKIELDLAW